ncbi:MAG: pitrilysin family protein [Bacteroidota bacterium]|nr:pitrilysin family protein [Bacteroidota bacterium]
MNSLGISERVQRQQVGPCSLLTLSVSVPAVVRWYGSFASNPDLECGDELTQVVLASLMDKGTRHRDRFELSDELERRGAGISVGSAGTRVEFRGRAMMHDFADVMALTAEILREPSLDEQEFEKVIGRVRASVEQARDSTALQADGALCRRLFSRRHPSHIRSVEEVLADLNAMSVDTVRSYYQKHVGANDLIVAITGDIDNVDTEKAVAAAVAGWVPHEAKRTHEMASPPGAPGMDRIPMDHKPALDVRLGHAVPVARRDPAWLPLHMGTFILGGNFSARLMRHIRDELGLTYGISARLRGMQGSMQGYFSTQMSLSRENLERGLAATRQMIQAYVSEGCSEAELSETKTTVVGAYQVSLSTTAALAARLHNNRVHGFAPDAIDAFVEEVAALTRTQVNDAVSRLIRPEGLHTVIAGSLDGPGS